MSHRILACKDNLSMLSKDKSLLKRTLTIDETWLSLYMSPNKDQAKTWRFPGEEPDQQVNDQRFGIKRMLVMAMDFYGICFYWLLDEKQTVDAECYKNILNVKIPPWLQGKPFKRPILLHDNAKPHKSKLVTDFLKEKNISTWFHPPYSPDISPLDFNCFHPLKRQLKGKKFSNWDEFISALNNTVVELNRRNMVTGVQQLPQRWQRVIEQEGTYI